MKAARKRARSPVRPKRKPGVPACGTRRLKTSRAAWPSSPRPPKAPRPTRSAKSTPIGVTDPALGGIKTCRLTVVKCRRMLSRPSAFFCLVMDIPGRNTYYKIHGENGAGPMLSRLHRFPAPTQLGYPVLGCVNGCKSGTIADESRTFADEAA
ncbi:hypothetical protein MTBLM1_90044 [Rhodospirillaceae bacterium LM-1]|nr:hypothetical protein MTBLM1_90044 [Rhodospirillaceae bacterium LM-1]